ncbi:NADH:ubiquinone oxidoreductase [Pseudomonas sp. GOM6]|uniref:NADH:ubiquinone oxidoreductase n=1 Tax=Pseudomonas sp. GOM6 TaxID=3036944 RepID=UPI002409B6E7|nr:NADH:ubiquinone oxidoreductase [Pseudomonas sp. GOM6]MDG1583169.1 NADH:ubiquinone oxidoreductase [Pseudomonas sp. GOM6]
MRAIVALWLLAGLSGQAWAEACVIHSAGQQLDVKLCQQNRSIPANLFREGFCAPQLKGQKVDVSFVAQCPSGAFGECRNAKVQGTPYQQDIFYYGVASDARYLKPACEQQSKGVWMAR